ncbi:MAG: BPTI/Kunitz domain-containing protein [Myxococcales bacterium]|nr:BPTI/Kunitz domain-containing protein [Myxococcales bacterium]
MRTLNHCLIVAVSALVTLGLACSGDDNASESDSTTTAPTSSTGGSSSTAATSTGETSGGGTGQCIPDQDPCGADCCNPGESCVDGMCVSDQSTGSTGTTGTTGTTGDVCNPDQTECGDDCCDVTEMCVDNACVPMTTDGSTTGTTGGTTTDGGDACSLMYDIGPCDGAFPRYWFNPESSMCEEFSWGGCEGVVPFEDLKSCQDACR